MKGLEPVKEQIDLLITLGISNIDREEAEKPLLEVMLNRVFLGNPWTGKTTVAKIYGKLLTELGLLSKGEVIVNNPSDFRGSVIGSSEKNTQDILRTENGNVLSIDEAYALCTSNGLNCTSDPYGTAVIDTLVEKIEARPGYDCAVVILGYRKEIENMFKNFNPGLSRRFQLELLLISDEAFIDWAARSHSSISLCIFLEPFLGTVIATGLDLSTNLPDTSKLISSSLCTPDSVTTWLHSFLRLFY